MNTCKYCATELMEEHFCPVCTLVFPESEICKDYKRPSILPEEIPTESELDQLETKQLLVAKTYFLYYALKQARQSRKHAIEKLKDQYLFEHYQKKCYIIENILIERTGTFPKRIDNKFLLAAKETAVKNEKLNQERVMRSYPIH
ncbi:MAG: hypothetical protein RSC23_16970 [Carnobacterium sp.]|uniref:hypothetical protein n=1 Tax=Carnobacterium sp. TaxID=48221 RepID=UPI002FCA299A